MRRAAPRSLVSSPENTDYFRRAASALTPTRQQPRLPLVKAPTSTALKPAALSLVGCGIDIPGGLSCSLCRTGTSSSQLIAEAFDYETSVERRSAKGGTSKSSVLEQIKVRTARLA